MPFNVGDRVRYIHHDEEEIPFGSLGVITEVPGDGSLRVRFDEPVWNPSDFSGWGLANGEVELIEYTMFEIGDRVICHGVQDGENIEGLEGIVVCFFELDSNLIGIQFDEYRYGFHHLEHRCVDHYGYWVRRHKLEKTGPKVKKERKRRGFATFITKIENTVDNVS